MHMKPGTTRSDSKTRAKVKDNIARWISFLALAALLAMATLPVSAGHHDVAAANTAHWSETWHG
jgi:hypothetical protein